MKDYRNALLLLLSLLLLISNGMLFAAIYYLYFKTPAGRPSSVKSANAPDMISQVNTIHPQKVGTGSSISGLTASYNAAILSTDSLKNRIDSQISTMARLRRSLDSLAAYPGVPNDSLSASAQIAALQHQADTLRLKIIQEKEANRHLQSRLQQLIASTPVKPAPTPAVIPSTLYTISNKNQVTADKALFLLYGLGFKATAQSGEQATKAEQVRSLQAVFKIKNTWLTDTAAQIFIAVLTPGGQSLSIHDKDALVFVTKEGHRLNAKKVTIEYKKGVAKEVNFIMGVKGLTTGLYTLKVYHRQRLIGKIHKKLL